MESACCCFVRSNCQGLWSSYYNFNQTLSLSVTLIHRFFCRNMFKFTSSQGCVGSMS